MADLTIKTLTLADADPAVVAASSGGDEVSADADTALLFDNQDASSTNVTLTSQVTAAPGIAAADIVIAVPASGQRIFSFKNSGVLKRLQDANSKVQITYSSVTSLNVGAFKLG